MTNKTTINLTGQDLTESNLENSTISVHQSMQFNYLEPKFPLDTGFMMFSSIGFMDFIPKTPKMFAERKEQMKVLFTANPLIPPDILLGLIDEMREHLIENMGRFK